MFAWDTARSGTDQGRQGHGCGTITKVSSLRSTLFPRERHLFEGKLGKCKDKVLSTEFEAGHEKDARMPIERPNKLLREARHSRDYPSPLWEDFVEVGFCNRPLYVHTNRLEGFEWSS